MTRGEIMTSEQLIDAIEGVWLTDNNNCEEVENVYIGDLLSWVMSHAKKGDAWITVLTNVNVAAVALLTEVSVVILPEDIQPEPLCLKKANENGIAMISTKYTAFEVAKLIAKYL